MPYILHSFRSYKILIPNSSYEYFRNRCKTAVYESLQNGKRFYVIFAKQAEVIRLFVTEARSERKRRTS